MPLFPCRRDTGPSCRPPENVSTGSAAASSQGLPTLYRAQLGQLGLALANACITITSSGHVAPPGGVYMHEPALLFLPIELLQSSHGPSPSHRVSEMALHRLSDWHALCAAALVECVLMSCGITASSENSALLQPGPRKTSVGRGLQKLLFYVGTTLCAKAFKSVGTVTEDILAKEPSWPAGAVPAAARVATSAAVHFVDLPLQATPPFAGGRVSE
eukprot:COSAG01_NODE_15387_length_1344_cov_1.302008_2_plen_216_part_00